uniref:Zinc knuckle CX2CX4HX4C n=1 Tax=Tanacetum cinerariifolium TaxID=118510 RepID=A0A6L2KY37_TANCI|nr:zinc knuckle CX2CX4HX4C [Tanacetum cinerariifolium]
MRSKRTIKPTKIFDNFVTNSSRNTNKYKINSKKSRDNNVSMNGTIEYDGDSDFVSNNQMKINGVARGNSMDFEENVFNVSTEEEIKESGKEEHVENSVNNKIEDTGVKQGNKEGKTGNRSVDERIGNGNINGTENGNYVSGNGVSHGKNGKTQNVEVGSNMDTSAERRRNTYVIMQDGPNAEAPCKILIWIKLLNVPLVAWSIRGINAISSRLGRRLMMDKITSGICKAGSGRSGFARVLAEVDASKELLEKIEIN